jgi:hypothetical protein
MKGTITWDLYSQLVLLGHIILNIMAFKKDENLEDIG